MMQHMQNMVSDKKVKIIFYTLGVILFFEVSLSSYKYIAVQIITHSSLRD